MCKHQYFVTEWEDTAKMFFNGSFSEPLTTGQKAIKVRCKFCLEEKEI